MPTNDHESYSFVVRIERGSDDAFDFCGTGFLVSSQYVVTCAHVVECRDIESDRDRGDILVRCAGELNQCYRGAVVGVSLPDAVLIRLEKPLAQKPVQLLVNIRTQHESAITEQGAFVAGFSSSHPDTPVVSRIKRIVDSLGAATTRQLLEIQIEGGRARGMSGSPVLVKVSGEYACLGILYLGGEGAATSRFMLADALLAMLENHTTDHPPSLNADDCLPLSENDEIAQLGKNHREWFLDYGSSACRLSAADQPISLAAVYVHRTRQEDRIKTLAEIHSRGEKGIWVSIQGQAGAGKTSLLWYLYNSPSLNGQSVVQPFVAQHVTEDFRAEQELIRDHLKQWPDRRCIVLIDTLDLIVGRGDKYLLSFLAWLRAQRAFIITTCRPLEALRLAAREVPDHLVRLERYTEPEAKIAVRNYVEMAYQDLTPAQRASQQNDLWNLLDGRRRVQELNFDPLILRMIFEAYPPNPVPVEINTALIYIAYWERCVVRVRRGTLNAQSERLRETVACRLAHAILFRETNAFDDAIRVVDFETAWQKYDTDPRAFPLDAFDSLLSGGVIEEAGGVRSYRFFHQTLLEFAAARFLLQAPAAVQRACIETILSDLKRGVLLRSPVLVQMAVQDAHAGGRSWMEILTLLLGIGSETACYLSLEIFGKVSDTTFCSSILREWKDRYLSRLAECAVPAVSHYPKPRIGLALTILEAVLETDASHEVFGDCLERFGAVDPASVLEFLSRTLPFVAKHELSDDDLRGQYKTTILVCFDAGHQAALALLASIIDDFNTGLQQGSFKAVADRLNKHSAAAIAEFLRAVRHLVYGPRANDIIEQFLDVLSRLHAVAPELAKGVAMDVLTGRQPARVDDCARLRGGLEGGALKTTETIPNALRKVTALDHLERLTAAATLGFSDESEHRAILEYLRSLEVGALDNSVRGSLFDVASNIGTSQPEELLGFISACPWPENTAGKAWRKIAGRLADVSPQSLKSWLLSRIETDRRLSRMTAVGVSQLLRGQPGIFTDNEFLHIFDLVLKSDTHCQRGFAECCGAIASERPALASRVVTEFTRPRYREVWASLAYSIRDCLDKNLDWVISNLPLLLDAAVSRADHGSFAKMLEALRTWPEDQRNSLARLMEDSFTAEVLMVFPQEKCQIEFLVLVKLVGRYAPDRAFQLLKRSSLTTPGCAGAAAMAAANIVAHTSDEKILSEVLELMFDVVPHGHQRTASNALLRAFRIIDDRLGGRRVISRFFAMYPGLQDAAALNILIRAVRKLPSWTSADSAQLLADTQRITGKIRSYVLKRSAD